MRGEVLILVNIPISHFQLSLTHSALSLPMIMNICPILYFRHGLECVDSCTAKGSERNFKFEYFLIRMKPTSGAGPTPRMLCPTTGRSAGQARVTRATLSRVFGARVVAR